MKPYYVVVANGSQAHFYSLSMTKSADLHLLESIVDDTMRKKNQDLVTDKPGHYQTITSARGAYSSSQSPKEREEMLFAKQIIQTFRKHTNDDYYGGYIIIAPSKFWGIVKKQLDGKAESNDMYVIQKDYTSYTKDDLIKAIYTEVKDILL